MYFKNLISRHYIYGHITLKLSLLIVKLGPQNPISVLSARFTFELIEPTYSSITSMPFYFQVNSSPFPKSFYFKSHLPCILREVKNSHI